MDTTNTPTVKSQGSHATNSKAPKAGRNVDGIMTGSQAVHVKPGATPKPAAMKPHSAHQPIKTPAGHTPQPAKTLMRRIVKKPAPSLKRHVTAHSALTTSVPSAKLVVAKPSAAVLDAKRLQHARRVARSRLVSRFGSLSSLTAKTVTTPVLTTPAENTPQLPAAPVSHNIPHTLKAPKAKNSRPRTTADILEHALKHATSHQQRPKRGRRATAKRIGSISAFVSAVLILVGFVAFQNLTGLRLRMASAQAGFSANLPGYQPSGYRLNHLSYSSGVVALYFHSNSDSRTYNITEKATNWDSNTLRDTFVATASQHYQTIESAGHTLYLIDEKQATWVNGGIWYQVQSNGSLDNHQLVRLASSM